MDVQLGPKVGTKNHDTKGEADINDCLEVVVPIASSSGDASAAIGNRIGS